MISRAWRAFVMWLCRRLRHILETLEPMDADTLLLHAEARSDHGVLTLYRGQHRRFDRGLVRFVIRRDLAIRWQAPPHLGPITLGNLGLQSLEVGGDVFYSQKQQASQAPQTTEPNPSPVPRSEMN